jgi:hypothetical protein
MSPLTEPTRIVLRNGWQPMDPDAAAYIAAVETADNQALEEKVKIAIDNFVLGCKADGIWSAIKASCILAGARTLNGALVPLVGAAPTNFNFVSADYNRKTGLVGNGSTKYLDSNRNNNADPQNSKHLSLYISTLAGAVSAYASGRAASSFVGASQIQKFAAGNLRFAINIENGVRDTAESTGFAGAARSASNFFLTRLSGTTATTSGTSAAPADASILLFAQNVNGITGFSNARLAFYSIGESLDLALLDARVTDLINAFGAAIP